MPGLGDFSSSCDRSLTKDHPLSGCSMQCALLGLRSLSKLDSFIRQQTRVLPPLQLDQATWFVDLWHSVWILTVWLVKLSYSGTSNAPIQLDVWRWCCWPLSHSWSNKLQWYYLSTSYDITPLRPLVIWKSRHLSGSREIRLFSTLLYVVFLWQYNVGYIMNRAVPFA